jgi:protein FAM32A
MFLSFSKIERRAGADRMFKQLQDRLQKEGVKTHKQRVEELNKYLSNLSEHHDMPRIGPG